MWYSILYLYLYLGERMLTQTHSIDNERTTFEDRLVYDKLTFYYLSLPIMLFGNLMGALLFSTIQIGIIDTRSIVIWLGLNMIMFLYGMYHYSLFRRKSEKEKLKNSIVWLDKYYTNILIYGILWGSSAFLMFPESNMLNQMILLFFLFAIGFTGMGILASKHDLVLTYILVTYTPILFRLFFIESGSYNTTLGYITMFLVLLMLLIANYYGNVINNSLQNRQNFITMKHSHIKLKERFFSLFERAPVGIFYYNTQLELEDINQHFINMHKVKEKKSLIGTSLYDVPNEQIIKAHKNVFDGITGEYRGPFGFLNNENLYVKLSTVPMMDAEGEIVGGISIINDITKEVTAKEQMVRTAYYDLLTNVPNRTLLMDKLNTFLIQKNDSNIYASLLSLDIDNFKKVNETYGHNIGDLLLKQVAEKLNETIGENEIFARVSGDKFVILLPSLSTEQETSEMLTMNYIQSIQEYFRKPLIISGESYHVTFSIGAILFNEKKSAFDLLKSAETAMYEAKKNTRGSSQFYDSSMSALTKEILTIENDIHKAIENNEFFIHYQPQLDVKENKVIGAEALVRWNHPEKGAISPGKFIPIAEESGIIIRLEEYIFHAIFKDIKVLFESPKGQQLKHIAINVSTAHFLQPSFVDNLMILIQKYKLQPAWIELEITESGLIRNIDDAIKKIKDLKNFGFTFSIDDFGTGYSSLSYLKELPVDTIKIDQSFILHMNENKGDAMIVESVIAIGKKFNLKIVAEGVETIEALDYLKSIQCDTYQGYFGYKPMNIQHFTDII